LNLIGLGNRVRMARSIPHQGEIIAFERQHLIRGKRTLRMAPVRFASSNERMALLLYDYFLAYSGEINTPHAELKRRCFQRVPVNHSLPFRSMPSRKIERRLCVDAMAAVYVTTAECLP
jgi:hypothetical protein